MSVVAVVPLYRWPLPSAEKWALDRFFAHAPAVETWAVGPVGLDIGGIIPFVPLHAGAFSSRASYSKLLTGIHFYEAFSSFSWLLLFQTDACWLGGEIDSFCGSTSDYIGAPWLRTLGVPSSGFGRVGNGGFSLRRIDRALAVLQGRTQAASFFEIFRGDAAPDLVSLPLLERFIKALRLVRAARRGVGAYAGQYTLNEDRFWSDRATVFDRNFKVASVEEGLRFSFEEAPRLAYEMNGRKLPLGTHAWQLYDPDFWYEMVPDLPRTAAR